MRFVLYLRFVLMIVLCGGLLTSVEAVSLQNGEYFICGIGADDIQVPAGSVITEAVLTIENPSTTDLYVHLLDNPDTGSRVSQDGGTGNVFDGYGVGLQGQLENGNLVFRFSQINDPDSDVWNVFDSPFNLSLADGSTVAYSSALLKLIDFAGTGRSFGFGIDVLGNASLSISAINFDITVSSYQEQVSDQLFSFSCDVGLIGFWGMEDNASSLTVSDGSGNGYDGYSARPTDQLSTAGHDGQSLWFDGISDSITLGHPSGLQIDGDLSLSMWFQAAGSDAYQFLISKGSGTDQSYSMFLMPSGNLRFQIFRQQEFYYVDSLGTLADGQWHHVVCVNDGDSLNIYVDGQLNGTQAGAGGAIDITSADVQLGTRGNKHFFNGLIDETAIYNVALSSDEIQQLYGQEEEIGLIGFWGMEDNASSLTVSDGSGNGYDGYSARPTDQLSTAGHDGQSLWFDGISDSITLGHPSGLQIDGDLSLSMWFQAAGSDAYQFLISKGSGTDQSYSMFLMPSGNLRFQIFRQQEFYYVDSLGTLADGQWHHVVCVNDGDSLNIYVDGQLNGTQAGAGGAIDITSADVQLGTRGNKHFFNGLIDETAIYNVALSSDEIQQLYGQEEEIGLIGFWGMEDNASSLTVSDGSGNGYDGYSARPTDQLSTAGHDGQSLWFDGISDSITLGHPSGLQIDGDLSLSMWFQAAGSDAYQFLISKGSGTDQSYSMFLMPSGNLRFQIFRQQEFYYVDSLGTLADGQWHHVVCVNDGDSLNIYVDGQLNGTQAGAGGAIDITSADVQLGTRGNKHFFNGLIDETAIYNVALSSDEIQGL